MVTDATNVFFFWVGVFSLMVFVVLAIKFTLREAILYGLIFLTNSAFTDSAFLPRLPVGGGNFFLSDAYLFAAILLVFFSGGRMKDWLPKHYWRCFLVFGGAVLIATFVGLRHGAESHYVLRELHYLPYYPLTMVLVLHAVRTVAEQERLLKFLAAIVFVSAIGSFLQLAVADHFQFMSYAETAFNLEGEQTGALRVRPPSQWLFLVFLVGALGTYPLWRRRRGVMMGVLTSLLLALFLGYSRAYFLAVGVGVAVIAFLKTKGWKARLKHAALALTLSSVAFLILGFAVQKMAPEYWSAFEDRIISSLTPAESDALYQFGSRLYEIEMATEHIREHPVLGLGVGTPYRDILPFEYRQADISENPEDAMHYMHDVYLYIWMKYGPIGALAGGWIVLLFLKRAWLLTRSDGREAVLFTGIIASFLALAASNLVGPSFVDSAAAPTLVGVMAGLVELGHQRLAHAVPRLGPRVFGRHAKPIMKPVDPEIGLTA